jgi:diketogulonate reductase-like aldo/keto reductase
MTLPSPSRRRLIKLAASSLSLPFSSLRSATIDTEAPPLLRRPIPSSAELLPAIGLGTWQAFDIGLDGKELAEAREALKTLVQHGGQLVDSSPMYGAAEGVVGQLVDELGLRNKLFIATKVWTQGRASGIRQMEASLRKLRTERLDLMQVHNLTDTDTHLASLRDWKKAGRVRYVGVTHYHAGAHGDLERIVKSGAVEFVQVNYSLAEPEAEQRLLPLAAAAGVAVIVNRPFAEGAMFQRVRDRPLPPIAVELGCASWAQFFLKWILGHPAVTCAIPGTRSARHVADNLGAARGPLPEQADRRKIAAYFDAL